MFQLNRSTSNYQVIKTNGLRLDPLSSAVDVGFAGAAAAAAAAAEAGASEEGAAAAALSKA